MSSKSSRLSDLKEESKTLLDYIENGKDKPNPCLLIYHEPLRGDQRLWLEKSFHYFDSSMESLDGLLCNDNWKKPTLPKMR